MTKECKIVEDLYPLVIEDIASEESKEFVFEHIDSCEECKEKYDFKVMNKDFEDTKKIDEDEVINKMGEKFRKNKLVDILFYVFLVLSIFSLSFSYLTRLEILSYDEAIEKVEEKGDDLYIEFTDRVYMYDYNEVVDIDDMGSEIYILAFSSKLGNMNKDFHNNQSILIEDVSGKQIVYQGGESTEDLSLIYGMSYGVLNTILLPRLALRFYFTVALVLGAISLLLFFIIRFGLKKKGKSKYLLYFGVLCFSYVISSLITGTVTYTIIFYLMKNIFTSLILATCINLFIYKKTNH